MFGSPGGRIALGRFDRAARRGRAHARAPARAAAEVGEIGSGDVARRSSHRRSSAIDDLAIDFLRRDLCILDLVAARASIVGACETSVGKVREHNEDSHFIDVGRGIFAVCDGMGGHAAGEVASALAVNVIRERWSSAQAAQVLESWLDLGTPEARKQLIEVAQSGVIAAHDAIVAEAQRDKSKHGMGTTVVGALIVGGDVVFAQCGDSRAYLVRDGIAMQLTEDHTLLARLLAAGVDVDTSAEGARFKSMLTNALGIGPECKVATFVVPVASGDRFLLCSDGVTEYVQEVEIGEVLTAQPSPARAAQKLVELALARGGADNATALVVKVIEAGETARPAEQLRRDTRVISACPLWAKSTPQGQLRALRIALPREYAAGDRIPAQTLGDRVAWIVVEGGSTWSTVACWARAACCTRRRSSRIARCPTSTASASSRRTCGSSRCARTTSASSAPTTPSSASSSTRRSR